MFTKFRNYTDRELYKEVSIHVDFRAGNEETHALQLLEEIRNRMPNWVDLYEEMRNRVPNWVDLYLAYQRKETETQ